jgi:spore coat polysaccharide biosynthesis protein SpsF
MGSSRLPGKVMLPLDCDHVLEHDVRRVVSADKVDKVVVATSEGKQDDIVARYAERAGASVYRGSEDDVLGRMYEAAREHDADVVVRVTADCPLVSVKYIDEAVERLLSDGLDYVSGLMERTFPRGTESEIFSFESFREVEEASDEPGQREHVTPHFYENPDKFDLYNVTSDEVFNEDFLQDRTDLRLTLDEADDYELLRRVYEGVEYDEVLDIADAVRYVDGNGLSHINEHVEQKKV